jgi:predicted flap endonuclease-1-like 5' DNA nuclease
MPQITAAPIQQPPIEPLPVSNEPQPVEPTITITQQPQESPIIQTETAPIQQPAESPLTKVKGIGEKRAAQLNALGIKTVDDLAKASVDEIAKSLKVSPKIVAKWVEGAKQA